MYQLPDHISVEKFDGSIKKEQWYSYQVEPPEDYLLRFEYGTGFYSKGFWYNSNGSYYWSNHQQSHPEIWMLIPPKTEYVKVPRWK